MEQMIYRWAINDTNRVILSMSCAVRESCDCSSAVRVRIIAAKDLTGTRCT